MKNECETNNIYKEVSLAKYIVDQNGVELFCSVLNLLIFTLNCIFVWLKNENLFIM